MGDRVKQMNSMSMNPLPDIICFKISSWSEGMLYRISQWQISYSLSSLLSVQMTIAEINSDPLTGTWFHGEPANHLVAVWFYRTISIKEMEMGRTLFSLEYKIIVDLGFPSFFTMLCHLQTFKTPYSLLWYSSAAEAASLHGGWFPRRSIPRGRKWKPSVHLGLGQKSWNITPIMFHWSTQSQGQS